MDPAFAPFISFVEAHRFIGYALLFLGMIAEGELILIAAGVLAHLGAFDPLDAFVIALVGVMIGDFLWYLIGAYARIHHRENVIVRRAEHFMTRMLPQFRERPFRMIIASKFMYGFNRPSLILSGFLNIPLALFAKAEGVASALWTALFFLLGYLASQTAISITHDIKFFGIIIAVVFLLILGISRLSSTRFR